MLSENDRYLVQRFHEIVKSLNGSLISDQFDRTNLKSELQVLTNLFQSEMQSISTEDYQVRSLLVEIDKQMRLIKMDSMFLQTARQAETIQQRASQMRDRLQLLLNYCDALLGTEAD